MHGIMLLFAVIQMRQGEKFVCLGEDQYLYVEKQQGDEMPQAVEFDDDDDDKVKEMKQLIHDMTSYRSSDRPSSREVAVRTGVALEPEQVRS